MVPMSAQPAQSSAQDHPTCSARLSQHVGGLCPIVEGDDPALSRVLGWASATQPRAARWTGIRAPVGDVRQPGDELTGPRMSQPARNGRSQPSSIATRSSSQPPAVRRTMSKGRLSSSSLATITPADAPRRKCVRYPGHTRHQRMLRVQRPLRRRQLHQHQPQRARSQASRFGGQHRAGQRARACPPVDHREGLGFIQLSPPCVQRPGQHRAEQRTHLRRSQKMPRMSPGPPPAGPHVEPAV